MFKPANIDNTNGNNDVARLAFSQTEKFHAAHLHVAHVI
jgi:hypothetical protein